MEMNARGIAETYARKVERVVKISDGDSLWLQLDLGYHSYRTVNVRLRGIDAPETNRGRLRVLGYTDEEEIERIIVAGLASKAHLTELLNDALPGGLYVITYKYKTDGRGRYLGDVYTADGTLINKQMVDDGHAVMFM